jgi:bifunctional ADP-heptose synthase (sugar kinase/adenylyltransferase)
MSILHLAFWRRWPEAPVWSEYVSAILHKTILSFRVICSDVQLFRIDWHTKKAGALSFIP